MWLSVKHPDCKDFTDISNIHAVRCVLAVSWGCSLDTMTVLIVQPFDLICSRGQKGVFSFYFRDFSLALGEENPAQAALAWCSPLHTWPHSCSSVPQLCPILVFVGLPQGSAFIQENRRMDYWNHRIIMLAKTSAAISSNCQPIPTMPAQLENL